MKIEVICPHELTSAQLNRWTEFQYQANGLKSPFYSPAFTLNIASCRKDAFVGVIYDDANIAGFFPFHLKAGKIGAPIGGPISDYQGVISAAHIDMPTVALLRGCGLQAFDFNHALQEQPLFQQEAQTFTTSPALDLSKGFETYRQAIVDSGTKELKNAERKLRKIEREIGPIRFVANDKTDAAWQRLIEWKNLSYARMGVASVLDTPWIRQALEKTRDTSGPDFSGMLSCLYAGDQLAAVHFGMRSRTAWHWWFPTYGPDLENYSPGVLLLLEMAKWGPEHGITWLDLGRGDARYKSAFSNASTSLCEGSIELAGSFPGAMRRIRKTCHRATSLIAPRFVDFQRRAFNRILGAGRIAN